MAGFEGRAVRLVICRSGSEGLLTMDLEAVEAGTEDLSLVYQRPWEDVAPERTFTVRVVVDG